MTPVELLQTALDKEKDAYRFYDDMLRKYDLPAVKDLLVQLKDAEYKHQKIIEEKIAEITKSF
ncbi:MAG: ferritin family protein [Candidatus Omnitrophota bacterium]